ncbi:MAG: transporter-like protein putative transport system ATP-binding protein [Patescibacteria group bacterium]|nr:transporter-like protein putative transport system ATP-binding protein [Patescibacteria group bacterium]
MLIVENLSKEFNSGAGPVQAVDSISFEVPEGKFAAIIGKSGSGKSTLLALLGALDKPTSGAIKVGDQDITKLGDQDLIKYRRNRIGFVFQGYNLVPNLTALENVMLPMEFAGVRGAERKARAASLLDQVGITVEEQSRKPSRLSGGQQQRVAIARALANRPQLILADEPTGNLDSTTGKLIVDLLRHLARTEKTTILAVTHDLEIARQTDLTFRLADGKLVGEERHARAQRPAVAA